MMSRVVGWPVVAGSFLVMVIGCAPAVESDPENDRLETGQVAILYSGQTDTVPVMTSEKTEWLPVGSRVEIVDDTAPEPEKSHRKTTVRIREGASQGKPGRVFRDNLRPVGSNQQTPGGLQ
jgi:hypothetical protein